MSTIIPIILCGGSGTRLWPLSRNDRPKQFISLFGDYTLLEETLLRARTISGAGDPICVTAAAYGAQVRQSFDRLGLRGRLLLEPEPRNTAPALCAAALVAMRNDPGAVIVALPADHVMEDGEAFMVSIAHAVAAAERGWLTILGVRPRVASTALGYIVPAAAIDGLPEVHRVSHFIEKPEVEMARSLISAGALWNAGIVVGRSDTVIESMRIHEPAVLDAVERSLSASGSEGNNVRLNADDFAAAPRISFDKAVLERHAAVAVTALDGVWRDVGSWPEVAELFPTDEGDNRKMGSVHLSFSRNSFVFSPDRLAVGIGIADLIIVDTPDALLIANRHEIGHLREVVEAMAEARYQEVTSAKYFPILQPATVANQASTSAIRVTLEPGEELCRGPHQDSWRHWIVIHGAIQFTINDKTSTYSANQSFHVPPKIPFVINNPMSHSVELVEVYLLE